MDLESSKTAILKDNYEDAPSRHSIWKYASNSSFQLVVTLLGSVQSIYLFFYYNSIIGMENRLIFLALTIYTIINAINDPIIAFLTDRNFKWTKKWGRRFPWIAIFMIPWCASLCLIFMAPEIPESGSPWATFIWLLVSLVLYDTFYSFISIHINALRPDLFRKESERRKLTYFWTYFDIAAQAIGMLVPPLFLFAGNNRHGFAVMAATMSVLCMVFGLLTLPGMKEDKEVIDRYFNHEDKKPDGFIKTLFNAIKLKSFLTFFIALAAFSSAVSLLMTMGPYVNNFLLRGAPGNEMYIYVLFLSGTIISVPIWLWDLKKRGNAKSSIYMGGFLLCIPLAFLTFFQTATQLYILFFLAGMAMGSLWSFFYTIIQAHVIDDFTVKTGTNQKAVLIGVCILLSRLIATLDEGIITLVQNWTGFPAGVENYQALADYAAANGGDVTRMLLSVRLLIGVVPAAVLLIGIVVFFIFYPLTPAKVAENKKLLEEMNL